LTPNKVEAVVIVVVVVVVISSVLGHRFRKWDDGILLGRYCEYRLHTAGNPRLAQSHTSKLHEKAQS
jgi:hypothetical protein